jgi:hypothetical protein
LPVFQRFQGVFLLVLRRVQEQLHQPRAIVDQLGFKGVDFGIGRLPARRGREAIHPFHQHPAIPGAIEHRDFAVAGQALPEAPQIMAGRLLLGWRRDRPDLAEARIQRGDHARHQPALARCVPAFDGDNALQALRDIGRLDQFKPVLQRFQLGVIIAARQIMIDFEIGEIVRAHKAEANAPQTNRKPNHLSPWGRGRETPQAARERGGVFGCNTGHPSPAALRASRPLPGGER